MDAPTNHMEIDEDKVIFPLKSGASLIKTKPVFSTDSRYLFCCSGTAVKVYSTVSGDCVRELCGHTDLVTGVVINPKNKLQLVSCSLDRSLIVWDYSDGVLIREINLPTAVHGLYTCESTKSIFLLKQISITECNLVELLLRKHETQLVWMNCCMNTRNTAVGAKAQYCVTVLANVMRVCQAMSDVPKKHSREEQRKSVKHKIDKAQSFTCVACHPTELCIATGCSDGKIYLWYKFLTEPAAGVKTTIHWHSVAVCDLTFTLEGSHLLSGGHECTLVKWTYSTSWKDFLPRLGAPINHVVCSPDNALFATCHYDNVIKVISSKFNVEQVYQGLTLNPRLSKDPSLIPTGLLCDPRSRSLVLNGKPGHIQFYSVHEDKMLYNLDIVSQNYISPENLATPLIVTEVTSAAFDSSGHWLATAEYWNDGVMSPEIRLKFWEFDDEKQQYILNTLVDLPHGDKVASLKLRPSSDTATPGTEHMAVTSSSDGKFKLWMLVDDTDIYRTNNKWSCESVGFYRDLPAGETAFSEDGSLLAVVFDCCITLWEPEDNQLKHNLINSVNRDPVRCVEFGRNKCSQYLVSCTANMLTVWDLLRCSVSWSVDLKVAAVVPDLRTDVMAVFTDSTDLFVFRPSDPTPIYSHIAVSNSDIISGVFIPHTKKSIYEGTTLSWQCQSKLYFMNQKQELLTVALESEIQASRNRFDMTSIQQNLPQSTLSFIMSHGQKSGSGVKVAQDTVVREPSGKYIKELLGSASHVQPPVSSLCRPFIQSLLLGNRKQRQKDDSDSDDDDTSPRQHTQTGSVDSERDSDMEVDGMPESSHTGNQSSVKKTPVENQTSSINSKTSGKTVEVSGKDLKAILKSDFDWYTTVT